CTGAVLPSASSSASRRATATDATLAAERRHRRTLSAQTWQHVMQLRQFDLQLAFAAARMTRENIENPLGAVDHPTFGGFLDVSLLHRGEVAVEDDQRRFVGRGFGANFIQLAATYQRRGIRSVAHLEHGSGDLRSRATR